MWPASYSLVIVLVFLHISFDMFILKSTHTVEETTVTCVYWKHSTFDSPTKREGETDNSNSKKKCMKSTNLIVLKRIKSNSMDYTC